MRYFNHNYVELKELPKDISFLVRSVGTTYVNQIEKALRANDIPYITAASRKDEVEFYVHQDERDNIEKIVKNYINMTRENKK